MSADYYVVGAPVADVNGHADVGQVFVYDRADGELVRELPNPMGNSFDRFGSAITMDGDWIVVGAPYDNTDATGSGTAHVFRASTGEWVAQLHNPNAAFDDNFGSAVAISGNTVIVGANQVNGEFDNSGAAFVFDAPTGSLLHVLNNPEPALDDRFGWAVAIAGDDVFVSALLDDTDGPNVGSIDRFNANSGEYVGILANPAPLPNSYLGWSLAATQDFVLAGVLNGDGGSGAVFQYHTESGAFMRVLANPTPGFADLFGHAVALAGDTIVVGAPNDDADAPNTGAVHLFEAATGNFLGTTLTPGPTRSRDFGYSVAVDGDSFLVGVPQGNYVKSAFDSPGAAISFLINSGESLHFLRNATSSTGDRFGTSVDVEGNRVLVGAPGDNVPPGFRRAGSAYLFDKVNGEVLHVFRTPEANHLDEFGTSVSLSGNLAAIGAPNARVTNFGSAGSVFVFDVDSGELVTSIPHPFPRSFSNFGWSVALEGDTLAVGAYRHFNQGAVYLFRASTGQYLRTLQIPNPMTADLFGWSVAISGDYVVASALLRNLGATNAGAVYVFDVDSGSLLRTIADPSASLDGKFGHSLALYSTQLIVGAPGFDGMHASDTGIAYGFNANSGELLSTYTNGSGDSNDRFGSAVDVSRTLIAVGTPGRLGDRGTVQVFDRNAAIPLATVDYPQSTQAAMFGSAVAVDGLTVFVGAPHDSSQNIDQGAVFVFLSRTKELPSTVEIETGESPGKSVNHGPQVETQQEERAKVFALIDAAFVQGFPGGLEHALRDRVTSMKWNRLRYRQDLAILLETSAVVMDDGDMQRRE